MRAYDLDVEMTSVPGPAQEEAVYMSSADGSAVRGAPPLREEGCPSTTDNQGKGEYPLLSTFNI
jgi:hypothetical protein